jgi:hypothetical protein
MADGRSPRAPFPRVVTFLRRHPVLLFLALTPGIPEYLSGSSLTSGFVRFPPLAFLFLGFNLGLYGPGALLVREAFVRWPKGWGWATLLCLGAAYGLLEEGTALSTLFNPFASVVGSYGSYGRADGVNWVWTIGVLSIHVVYSVGLPIVLLGLALPETRGRPLLSTRGIRVAVAIYAVDIALLVVVANYWRQGAVLLVLAAVVAGLLWVVARHLPYGLLDPTSEEPRRGPGVAFLIGLAFFPILLLVPAVFEAARAPAPIAGAIEIAVLTGLFFAARAAIGRTANRRSLTALALGATLPLVVFGFFANLSAPIEVVVDALYGLFFYALWTHYRPAPAAPPAGATA